MRRRIFIEMKHRFHRIDPIHRYKGARNDPATVMLTPVHDIPGRLRFRLALLRGDRRAAAALRRRVRAIQGVHAVSANPLTGSLIVHHDDAAATRVHIATSLAEFRPAMARRDPEEGFAGKFADVLANAIAERLIEHAMRVAVAAVI